MISLAVLTTGRQDWGILRSVCVALRGEPGVALSIYAGGMHLSSRHGATVDFVVGDGFEPVERLAWVDEAEGASAQAGLATKLVGEALARRRPDALVLLGDRFETAAAAMAATIERTPVAHLHGGEETAGAIDNALRHAITKMSHLHLVSHAEHARRVIAMGEDPSTVHVVGAPGLDNVLRTDLADRAELERHLGVRLEPPLVLVTLHPTTLGASAADEARAVTDAMRAVDATYVVTLPNADPNNEITRAALLATKGPRTVLVEALGERRFWGLLRVADAMLGNSSAAVIEAPVVQLPAVNVGARQDGRLRGANLVDAPPDPEAVMRALRRALDPAFRRTLAGTTSPFGDGTAGARAAKILGAWTPPSPPRKAFHEAT